MKYDGKTALITGGASPIGLAVARRLSAGGANIALADIDPDALGRAGQELGVDPLLSVADLSDEHAASDCVNSAIQRFGKVDILVNNAGGGVIEWTRNHTPTSIRQTIDRNLWTMLWVTRASLPSMVKHDYGRIVNIGADSVRNGLVMHAIYNAAKGGVHAIASGLAREYAQYDITVNVVAPCMVLTPQVIAAKEANNPIVAEMEAVIPKGRSADPDEVASMVSYLCLDEARFVTGQVISVNGGSTMQ
jgi:2,3-dihydroxy-2,3-dihydro-p-cumate dehydrogenase